MENNSFLSILKKDNKIIIYNRSNGASIKIHKEIYDIIKDLRSKEAFNKISAEYEGDDKKFLDGIGNIIIQQNLYNDSTPKGIRYINYIITDFCNLKCSHCSYSAFHVDLEKSKPKIIADMSIIETIIKYNPEFINITGGEPLIVDNFKEVIRSLRENYKGKVILSTNATLINDDNICELCNCFSKFSISLDGINQDKCDSIRGKGTFNKVIEAISKLQKHGATDIALSAVLTNDTMDDREKFEKICKELNVNPEIRLMSLRGRAKENDLTDSDKIYDFTKHFERNPTDCLGGISDFTVNSKGHVFPCPNFVSDEYKIGNILKDDIISQLNWDKKTAWFKEYSKLLPLFREECKDCDVNVYCWRCPLVPLTYLENGGSCTFSKMCQAKKEKMREVIWDDRTN